MAHPLNDLRPRVQAAVDAELVTQRERLHPLGPDPQLLVEACADLLSGGKRLRAGFLYWGYRAAGGHDSDALVRMASSMEYFQAAALIHDDVMDNSDTRRGAPAAHTALASRHAAEGWHGDSDAFGRAGAILAGNLCLEWSDEVYAGCGLPADQVTAGRPAFDTMRTQLMAGQFLDILEAARGWDGLSPEDRAERARSVIRWKSANYTITQPLQIGALAAGAEPATLAALHSYGEALGVAFQLRDDVLGVFGDPGRTGKPAGDDLREGKHTVLVAHALAALSRGDAAQLVASLGQSDLGRDDVDELQGMLLSSGAVAQVENEIAVLAVRAHRELDQVSLDAEAHQALVDLVEICTSRDA